MKWFLLNRLPIFLHRLLPEESVPMRANMFQMLTIKPHKKTAPWFMPLVSIHTSVCPECGKTYVSGGTTNTAIRYPNEDNPYQKNRKAADATILPGANFDVAV